MSRVAPGLCECGCGEATSIASRTRSQYGMVKGKPLRFLPGHSLRTVTYPSSLDRFWVKVNKDGPVSSHRPELGPCWLWLGAKDPHGYGTFWVSGRFVRAHRFAYQELTGPVAKGLYLDHLCRVRHCVNPDHLEPVTNRVNILRGQSLSAQRAAQTHCTYGHEFTPENTYIVQPRGQRRCRKCAERLHREAGARLKANPRVCPVCEQPKTNIWRHIRLAHGDVDVKI